MFSDLAHPRAYPLRRSSHIRPELAPDSSLACHCGKPCILFYGSQLFELVLGRKSKRRTCKALGLVVLISDFYRCAKWTIRTVLPGLSYRLLASWIHFASALRVLGKKGGGNACRISASLTYRQYMAYGQFAASVNTQD